MDAGNDIMYETVPIISKIVESTQHIVEGFGKLPNIRELPFYFTCKNTCSPTLKSMKNILFHV